MVNETLARTSNLRITRHCFGARAYSLSRVPGKAWLNVGKRSWLFEWSSRG